MKSFKDYLLQHKIRNLQPGDKVKYIGNGIPQIKSNEILTFLKWKEIFGRVYVKTEEYGYMIVNPKNIVKI